MPRPPQRPGSVLFAAIVLIIVGTLSLLCDLMGGGMIAVLAAIPAPAAKEKVAGKALIAEPPDPFAEMRFIAKEAPGYYVFSGVSVGLDLLLGLGQLICGIGLLRMSSSARLMAILLTVVKLLAGFGGHVYNFLYVMPAQARFHELNPPLPGMPDMASLTQTLGMGMVVIYIVIQLAIALTIVLLLLLPGNRQAFIDAASPQPEEQERRPSGYDDDDDGYGAPARLK